MKLYIELLIPLLIALMFAAWFLWLNLTKLFYKWRYKPENDRGKKGEEHRQELIRRGLPDPNRRIAEAIASSGGQTEPNEHSDVQTTGTDSVGKNSPSPRKTRFRRIFRRRQ